MLPKYKNKNSWILSVSNKINTKYFHYYFCTCGKEFKLQTELNEPEAPDILCPMCGNDYFKDVKDFISKDGTRIWKYFQWDIQKIEHIDSWAISLIYQLPIYNSATDEVKLENQEFLSIKLKKDGSSSAKISYKSKLILVNNLYFDGVVKPFKQLLLDDAKMNLYHYIMSNKSIDIKWINDNDMKEFPIDDRLKYLTFFLKNSHLKEHSFFFWEMNNILEATRPYSTQVEMLDFIINNRKEKSVKKALYRGYKNSMNHTGYYYPYSDYIFSRSIENIDLLIKLYRIYPAIKQHIFTDETFAVAIEFVLFLKRYYTEKQIVKLFVEDMQDVKEYKNRLIDWRDTLRMLQTRNAFNSLNEHFSKVKLTVKKLHDEIVRVFHIVSYELDAKESFEYNEVYLSACGIYEDLEFKLPSTVKELSLWAKMLHNCMFGYSRRIHQEKSIIYGVFKAEALLYAIELNGFRIVQAKAVFNNTVPDEDMSIINSWKNDRLMLTQT